MIDMFNFVVNFVVILKDIGNCYIYYGVRLLYVLRWILKLRLLDMIYFYWLLCVFKLFVVVKDSFCFLWLLIKKIIMRDFGLFV